MNNDQMVRRLEDLKAIRQELEIISLMEMVSNQQDEDLAGVDNTKDVLLDVSVKMSQVAI